MENNKFKEFYNRVIDWNRTASDESEWSTPQYKQLYWNLLREEIFGPNEFYESFNKNDVEGTVDGMCDAFVVASQLLEINKDVCDEVYIKGMVTVRKFFDIANPILCHQREDSLFYLMSALCQCMDQSGYPIDECMNEVLLSNESKFIDSSLGLDWEAECRWIQENRGIKEVYFQERNGKVVFRNKETHKICKPSTFVNPNLKQYLDKMEDDV